MPKKGSYKKGAKPKSVQARKFNSKPQQKKNRAARNAARARAVKAGTVSKGDGKVVNHKKRLGAGGSNAKSNTSVQSKRKSAAEGGRTRRR
jgi:hypothetical protein